MHRLARRTFAAVATILAAINVAHAQRAGDGFDGGLLKEAMRAFVGPDGICQEHTGPFLGVGKTITSRSCVTTTSNYELVAKGNDYEVVAWLQWNDAKISKEELEAQLRNLGGFVRRFGFDGPAIQACAEEAASGAYGRKSIAGIMLECRRNRNQWVMDLKALASKPKSDF